jgi:aminopeptidase YwaD
VKFKLKSFDADSAYGFMERLAKEIGNRESGTDSEWRAAQQIRAWFEEFGLVDVRFKEFEVKSSRILREEAWLSDGTRLECSGVGNSLSTPPEGVEGEVVLLGSTSNEELRRIKGKIATVNMVLYEKDFYKVVEAKPLALLYPSRVPSAPNIFRAIRAEYTEKRNIPAVSMAHDDVLSLLQGQKRLKIITEVEKITAKSRNVLAEVPGTLEDENLLIGGHYDTVRRVVGAHDNAAGIAMVLEVARTFAHEKLNRTLRLAAWGSEELGLRGSFHYAENPENLRNLRFYLNFDVHGILLGSLNAIVLGPTDLMSILRFTAKELGIPVQLTTELGLGGSDHMPMAFYGIPSMSLSRRGGAEQIMHTSLEDLRWCSPDAFIHAGRLSQTLLERLLKAEELPFEKEIPNDIAKALERRFADSGIRRKTR